MPHPLGGLNSLLTFQFCHILIIVDQRGPELKYSPVIAEDSVERRFGL